MIDLNVKDETINFWKVTLENIFVTWQDPSLPQSNMNHPA